LQAAELDEREAGLEALTDEAVPAVETEPVEAPAELERIETKLAELRAAEQAFARTHAELAQRSDGLAEREAQLAARERALAAKETPASSDLERLEARIRRLEQGGRKREAEPQTFSVGLRALQERGLRPKQGDQPLH
jgi:chromosome segregation ATPase